MRHPDEGTIHAWLDGALPAEEARMLEAHAASCTECASAVAEARGLLAASTRILSALDSVPGGVIPESPMMSSGARAAVRQRTVRKGLHVGTGAWRVAAAVLVLAGGSWLVERGTRREPARDQIVLAAYVDTTSIRVPGVIVDAPPSRQRAEMEVASADPGVGAASAAPAPPPAVAPEQQSPAPGRSDIVASTQTAAAANVGTGTTSVADTAAAILESRADTAAVARMRVQTPAYSERSKRVEGAELRQERRQATADMAPAPRLVVDPAYVDSVLAADSVAVAARPSGSGRTVLGYLTPQASAGAPAARTAPAPTAPPAAKALRPEGLVTRAAGCWVVDTSAWTPRARGDEEALFPRRIELRTERGVLGDEWGELVARPAPGEEAFPAGTAATWKSIGRDALRITIGDDTRWTVATVTLEGDSLSGWIRAYKGGRGQIRSATVTGTRVVCRTEP